MNLVCDKSLGAGMGMVSGGVAYVEGTLSSL